MNSGLYHMDTTRVRQVQALCNLCRRINDLAFTLMSWLCLMFSLDGTDLFRLLKTAKFIKKIQS